MTNDLTGQKFNKWTVIKRLGVVGKGRDVSWECKCECGAIRPVKSYYLTKGYSTQCVACGHKPKPYDEELSIVVWNKILSNAKKRNIRVSLSKEEAYKLFLKQKKLCALSSVEIKLPENGTQTAIHDYTASLDRIDSSKGYEIDNVQWVHKDINRMKNVFSQEYFIKMCRLIAKNVEKR